ncbi:hypothetical protein OAO18_01700 [Francisellaceae bacterium]|nr:hypothetical protein [Francisellaceae bacterium]
MFGLNNSELLLTCIIGLLVLGPTQLKQVAKIIITIIKKIKKEIKEIAQKIEHQINSDL